MIGKGVAIGGGTKGVSEVGPVGICTVRAVASAEPVAVTWMRSTGRMPFSDDPWTKTPDKAGPLGSVSSEVKSSSAAPRTGSNAAGAASVVSPGPSPISYATSGIPITGSGSEQRGSAKEIADDIPSAWRGEDGSGSAMISEVIKLL